jgi:hypothetical protein
MPGRAPILRQTRLSFASCAEVGAGVDHAGAEHRAVEIVPDVVVTLPDLEGARHLQVEDARFCDVREQGPVGAQADARPGDTIDHLIERLAVPPAVDVGLADAEGAVAQHAGVHARIVNLDVPGRVAADADARAGQHLAHDVGGAAAIEDGA